MRLDRFRVFSYKNLEGAFNFSPITVIVGPNGSGKTALFEAMSLFANMAIMGGPSGEKPIDGLLRGRGGLSGFGGVVKDGSLDKKIIMDLT